jgi:hypothetical protein
MKRDRVWWARVTGFSLVACTALLLVSQAAGIWLATRRTGTGMLYDWSITLFLLSFFGTLFLIPVALIGLPFRATRLVALATLSALAVHVASSMLIGPRLHEWWVQRLTPVVQRAGPLLGAIQQFEQEHGAPPTKLEALIPRYLPAVPGTGLAGYPAYEYEVDSDGRWTLSVDVSHGVLDWTHLVYNPLQTYPPRARRLGEWAYVASD